ncbi:MAG TPA: hypothetical protein VGK32_21955 [Vicinamibacterales bacterium]|jgi:hypothetical protein
MNSRTSRPYPLVGLVGVVLGLVLTALPAAAQSGAGVRAGVSASPDQFVFGAHFDTGPLFERVSFRPNVEVGVGNDLTTVSGNFEFVYWIPLLRKPWSLYAGGGPAVNVYRYGIDRYGNRGTDTQPGFNLLVGIAHHGGVFTEVKAGLIDSPNVRVTVGYTWQWK